MEERKYTLDEAREILRTEQCERLGEHDLEQESIRLGLGSGARTQITIHCTRCDLYFNPVRD